MTLSVGLLTSLNVAYKVVVLPLPVGPAHSTIPNGERTSFEYAEWVSARHAEVVQSEERTRLVQNSHDAVFAHDGRHRRDAHVDLFAVDGDRQLTVLRTTTFDDVHVRHDLDSTHESRTDRDGQLKNFFQRSVNTEIELGRNLRTLRCARPTRGRALPA
jgi:hypothetical protein